MHEAIVALHRNDLLLYKAADAAVASRFLQLGKDGEEESDRLQLRKRQLAFHCQREGPRRRTDRTRAAFDGDPCVPYLINDASFQMYLSRKPPSYVFDGRTFVDVSGTPGQETKRVARRPSPSARFTIQRVLRDPARGPREAPFDAGRRARGEESNQAAAGPGPRDVISECYAMPLLDGSHLEAVVGVIPDPVSPNSSVFSCASTRSNRECRRLPDD